MQNILQLYLKNIPDTRRTFFCKRKVLKHILFLVLVFAYLTSSSCWADPNTNDYGIYGNFPLASTGALGMGGAFTGLSNDVTGMIYNPAGTAFGNWTFDIGSTQNLIINKEVDLTNDDIKDGIPYRFEFSAGAISLGNTILGLGRSTPYHTEIQSSGNDHAYIDLTGTDVLVAYRLSQKFALGLTWHSEKLKEFIHCSYGEWSATAEGSFITYGLSFRPTENIGFGLTYNPPRHYEVDSSLNNNIGSMPWFRGAAIPGRTTLGLFFNASGNLTYLIDLDIVEHLENASYVGNPFSYATTPEIKNEEARIFRGGIEYAITKSQTRSVYWRFGGYREPARVVGAIDRLHITTGLEIRLGLFVVSASMDQASDFSNTAQGISLSLGDFK